MGSADLHIEQATVALVENCEKLKYYSVYQTDFLCVAPLVFVVARAHCFPTMLFLEPLQQRVAYPLIIKPYAHVDFSRWLRKTTWTVKTHELEF